MQVPGCRATSYSTCIAAAASGTPKRGIVYSVFDAAANLVFPSYAAQPQGDGATARAAPTMNEVLSLNCDGSPRVANGLHLSAPARAFPFSALRPGMPVLFGAQRLHIEAINCSLDLSTCPQWDPHIFHPEKLDMALLQKNAEWLARHASKWPSWSHNKGQVKATTTRKEEPISRGGSGVDVGRGPLGRPSYPSHEPCAREGLDMPTSGDPRVQGPGTPLHTTPAPTGPSSTSPRSAVLPSTDIVSMAAYLCGRGEGLTPSGDDILAGWMAAGWLLNGPMPDFLETCFQILRIAERQTHLLSQCWLRYAASGNVAEPVGRLLAAMTREDDRELEVAADAVLAMGATSGHDLISGILLHIQK